MVPSAIPSRGRWQGLVRTLLGAMEFPQAFRSTTGRVTDVHSNIGGAAAVAAVLWDLDGTLVDSESYWLEVAEEILCRDRRTMPGKVRGTLVGASAEDTARILIEAGVEAPADQLVHEIVNGVAERLAASVRFRPGALDLLASAASAGVPQALVTMSWHHHVRIVLDALPAHVRFDAVVAGDDVSQGKPDPEAYLRAAALLGVQPEDCVAIEDSRVGVQAALLSGATTIAVPHHQRVDDLQPAALWDTLQRRTVVDLAFVHSERLQTSKTYRDTSNWPGSRRERMRRHRE